MRVAHVSGSYVASGDYGLRRFINSVALFLGDASALATAIVVAATIRMLLWDPMQMPVWMPMLIGFWLIGGLFLRLYPGWGTGPADELRSTSRAVFFACAATIVTMAMARSDDSESRFVLLATMVLALGFIPLTRYAVRRMLMLTGWWGTAVAVYGSGSSAQRLVHLLRDQPHIGLHPVAVFADDPSYWGHEVDGVPVLGDTNLVHPDASVAVLAVSGSDHQRSLVEGTLRYYRRVLYIPEMAEHSALVTNTMDIGGLLGLELRVNLSSRISMWTKRCIDLAFSIVGSVIWVPASAVAALVIWMEDRTNPFFIQRRLGRGGHEIRVWKLRTMVPDAEGVLARALIADPDLQAEWESTSKLKNDPRVTRAGRIIRRLSIDELPQLWNVLRGDMSLVGPRPLPTYHEDKLPESGREMRRNVRPGVTGLWQVSGRSDTGDEAMGWLDAYYVRNWSFWLDAAILLRTMRAALAGTGAY